MYTFIYITITTNVKVTFLHIRSIKFNNILMHYLKYRRAIQL